MVGAFVHLWNNRMLHRYFRTRNQSSEKQQKPKTDIKHIPCRLVFILHFIGSNMANISFAYVHAINSISIQSNVLVQLHLWCCFLSPPPPLSASLFPYLSMSRSIVLSCAFRPVQWNKFVSADFWSWFVNNKHELNQRFWRQEMKVTEQLFQKHVSRRWLSIWCSNILKWLNKTPYFNGIIHLSDNFTKIWLKNI